MKNNKTITTHNLLKMMFLGTALFAVVGCQKPADPQEAAPEIQKEATTTETDITDNAATVTGPLTNASMSENEKLALELFAYQDGEWNSEWIMFDAAGNETGRMTGDQSFSYIADKYSQLMIIEVPAVNHKSYTVRGYNMNEGQIVSMNMGPKGDYWIMRQNPATAVTQSNPHVNEDGTTSLRRYSRSSLGEKGYRVIMEVSLDGGETWFKRYEQKLRRKPAE